MFFFFFKSIEKQAYHTKHAQPNLYIAHIITYASRLH